MKDIFCLLIILLVGFMTSCESLEDTYSDYTGDGPERYLTKIYNLQGTPQWLSVLLTWDLKLDPGRTAILVKWTNDEKADSVIIDKESTSYVVKNLENNEYTFTVNAIEEKEGKIKKYSLGDPVYVRPYSYDSDELLLFGRVVSKTYNVANKNLFVLFDSWPDHLQSFKIGYFEKGDATEQFWEASSADKVNDYPMGKPYVLVGDDVDFSKPIRVYRKIKTSFAGDEMELELKPIDVYFDIPVFESSFAAEVRSQFDLQGEIKRTDINDVEVLEIDYDQLSLVDVLHFPNLKKLYLGRNRYITKDMESKVKSTLHDVNVSIEALKIAKEKLGVEIYHYGKHYFDEVPDFFTQKNEEAQIPSLGLLDTRNWIIAVSPEDQDYNSGLQNLLDLEKHYWSPQASQTQMREHVITIDMGEVQTVKGFLVMQAEDIKISSKTGSKPESLKIELLNEFGQWEQATFSKNVKIGTGTYEKTIIYLNKNKETKRASKVRFMIYDVGFKNSYSSSPSDYKVALSTFMVFQGE